MNRRCLAILVVSAVLSLSGSQAPSVQPAPETPPIPQEEEEVGPSYQELADEYRLQLFHTIRTEHLVTTTKAEKGLASRVVTAVRKETACYDIDPNRILALIIVESWCNPDALSHKGAMGLMQVLPDTGAYIARHSGFRWRGVEELRAVESNIAFGTWYYHHLLQKFGDEHAAIAAYNWGPVDIANRLRLGRRLPQVYPGKVFAAEKELQEVIQNEYNARFWRGIDQYISAARSHMHALRSERGSSADGIPVDDEQGICGGNRNSVP